jgi:hypothetical protein
MKAYFELLVVFCLIAAGNSGCSRASPPVKQRQKQENPLALARELYRSATDAPQFRDANERTNGYLAANPDALPRHYPGTKDNANLLALLRQYPSIQVDKLDDHALYQKFLETTVGLDEKEIDDVESPTFKLMDGHYLEGCYFFREIARSMPLQALPALEQAGACFAWVTRQMVLQQGRDEILPPQFALRRGQGSAAERVFVFISLLQQLTPQLDGCLIALPGKAGQVRPWLAGVLIADKDQGEVYLFDPRLGLPVPGPHGKGIATLAQLRANPTLLEGFKVPEDLCKYDVDAADVARAEILVACPMSALSARMRYLEDELLLGYDQIHLSLRAALLLRRFQQLKIGAARVWNVSAPKPGLPSQSPTRALRLLLPVEEGGVDKNHQLDAFNRQLLPWPAILQGFAEQKPAKATPIGLDAEKQLEGLAGQIWINYIYTPSQELLRGRLDDCTKRLIRIQKVVDDVRGNNPDPGEIAKWRKKVRDAYVERDTVKIAAIWNEDQWLRQLVAEPDEEPANPKLSPKMLLSDIVLGAVNEPMHLKCSYLLALRWQELAERLQMQATHTAGGAAARTVKVQQNARAAWSNANSWWSGYGHDNPLTLNSVRARLAAVKKQMKGNPQSMAGGLLEYYDRLVREAAAARLMQAGALEAMHERDAAIAMLKSLVTELTALEKEMAMENLFWLKYSACMKLAELERPL